MLVPQPTDTLVSSGMIFTAYSEILQALDEIQAEGATTVVLHISSGGGVLAGLWDVLERIKAMRESGTTFIALADQLAASAAYMIASEANQIVATVTTEVGSVGVYSILTSISDALTASGVRNVVIASGELKAKGNALKPITDQDVESEQRLIDALFAVMRDRVQANRPNINMDTVGTGDLFLATEAQSLGLVDDVIQSVLAFNAQYTEPTTNENDDTDQSAQTDEDVEEEIEEEIKEKEKEQKDDNEDDEDDAAEAKKSSVEHQRRASNGKEGLSREEIAARLLRAGASRSLVLAVLEDRELKPQEKLALFAEQKDVKPADPREMLKRYYAQYREDYARAHHALKQRRQ
jgi:ClpP class serine protease